MPCLEPESELEPVGEGILGLDLVLVQENYLVVAAVQSSLHTHCLKGQCHEIFCFWFFS
jgi:hypothetical protein